VAVVVARNPCSAERLYAQLPVDADSAGVANQTGWTPERITFPGNAVICALSGGDSHSAALATDGSVFAWGSFRDKSGCFGASSLLTHPHTC
jgi:alpha-tubulin suppressor-like RCC1 family protein